MKEVGALAAPLFQGFNGCDVLDRTLWDGMI